MSDEISGPLTLNLKAGELVCCAGQEDFDLYIIHSGKLLIYVNDGTKVTPLAYLGEGEYLGELSFFDHMPRSAHVATLEPTTLIQVPVEELERQFPEWLITIAQNITSKLRRTGDLIRQKGIRKQNVESIKPLTMDEQRHYYQLVERFKSENNIQG
ncbi:MAG: CRP-like cAMP-binding protein [Bacteriovoracaceae bacterium]|jgi:CRP-like cAMP-binding protein